MHQESIVAEFAVFKDAAHRKQSLNLTLTSGDVSRDSSDCAALAMTISKQLIISTNTLKKIVREAGGSSTFKKKLNEARASLPNPVTHGDVLILDCTTTRLGKYVLLAVHPTPHTLEACYSRIVTLCEKKRLNSLAIPCIGSGLLAIAPSVCADALCRAVNNLPRQRKSYLKGIKIIDQRRETVERFAETCEMALQFKQRIDVQEITASMSISIDKAEKTEETEGEVPQNAELNTTGWTDDEKLALKYVKFGVKAADDVCVVCLSSLCDMGNETPYEMKENNERMESGEEGVENRLDIPVAISNCNHQFHFGCFVDLVAKSNKKYCPTCRKHFAFPTGDQPIGSVMEVVYDRQLLPGYENSSNGTIIISYLVPNGIQEPTHLRPGQPFFGTTRWAFLPLNDKGEKVLKLLRKAFECRLIFTVGDSITSGLRNVAVWNNIHHKTSRHGGSENYGYPDPEYLDRVTEELAQAGVTEDMI